ncbi:MAG: T9SS type A sorting domain-containing protein [Flavobacteriales bacterium]|nr:T9SS type A sorting domain-containing protein [Flavobacteriales bacterium]
MKIKYLISAMIVFVGSLAWAQNTECSGLLTANDAVDGGTPFVNGYTYNITTSGSDVTVTYELLDTQVGLVGFFQTLNPDFVETFVLPDPGTQIMTTTYTGFTAGDIFTVRPKFAYAGGFSTGEYQTYTVGEDCGVISLSQVDLPVTFDDPLTDYDLVDFGGNATSIIVDPSDAGNMVAQSIRTAGALSFAGTTIGAASGFENPIPFDNSNTGMSVRVYSPAAGVVVKLKVENADGTMSVESDQLTTVSNAWETLTYDLANEAVAGVIDLGVAYVKASIFFNFGLDGGAEEIYLWDDLQFAPGVGGISQIDLPVDFENPILNYGLTDFGGNASSIITDPGDAGNTVVQSIRTAGSEVFAGTTLGQPLGLENAIPFDFDNTQMSVRVLSPAAGVVVKLKVEQVGAPAVFVEADVLTSTSGTWETLVFDFASPAAGSLNLSEVYNLPTIFFNFGQDQGTSVEEIYLWDDVQFIGGGGLTAIELPITFDETEYTVGIGEFGGSPAVIVPDPADPANNVAQTTRISGTAAFSGNVVPTQRLTTPIPFDAENTTMTFRVWSPEPGIEVLLKVEGNNPADFVEKLATTTTSGEWETLEYDFSSPSNGSLNLAVDYNLVVVLFNFGVVPAADEVYFWDDIQMAEVGPAPCENPYPEVDFASLGASVLPNGKLEFTWDPIEGQIGCQINIIVGDGPQQASIIRPGANASNFIAPVNQLVPFTTYNFRVRCGCSQNPLIAGAYTAFQSVFYIPPSIGVENGSGYSEEVIRFDDDRQWNNSSMTNEVVTEIFAMDHNSAWVNVAPNPAQDNVNLSYNSMSKGQGLIQVFDAQGKLAMERIMTFQEGLNRVNLNMNELENGIYLVEVIKDNTRESVRLLMQ